MDFEIQMSELIQRYLKETRNQDLTIAEILSRPRWTRVWFWWKAKEYYEGTPMPELTLSEVKDIYGDK
ncbi:hypothetical protein D3C74_403410 [compost metagenome]